MKLTFSESERARLQDEDFTLSYDLVGEAAYREIEKGRYEVRWPDDGAVVETDNIEAWLGTG